MKKAKQIQGGLFAEPEKPKMLETKPIEPAKQPEKPKDEVKGHLKNHSKEWRVGVRN